MPLRVPDKSTRVRSATSPPDTPEGATTSAVDYLGVGSAYVWIGLAVMAWIAAGVVAAVVLGRRGHHVRSLLGLAVVFGPLFVPLALDFVRHREPEARVIELDPPAGPAGPGRHVIVAVLGDPEAVVDALTVLDRFGPVAAVTLAAAIDFESADRSDWDEVKTDAEQRLNAAAAFVTELRPTRVLVPGRPESALARLVGDEHDLIVITGVRADVGSERLSVDVGIPVIVAPRLRKHN